MYPNSLKLNKILLLLGETAPETTRIMMTASKNRLISHRSTCKVCNLGRDLKQTIIPNTKRRVPWEQIILCNHSKDIWKRVQLEKRNSSNLLTIEELVIFIRNINSWTILKRKLVKQSTTQTSLKSKLRLEYYHVVIISTCISKSPIKYRFRVIFCASKTWVTEIWADIMIYNRWLKTCYWIHKMSLLKKQTRIYHHRFTRLWKGTLKSQIWGLSYLKIALTSKSFTEPLQQEVLWMYQTA